MTKDRDCISFLQLLKRIEKEWLRSKNIIFFVAQNILFFVVLKESRLFLIYQCFLTSSEFIKDWVLFQVLTVCEAQLPLFNNKLKNLPLTSSVVQTLCEVYTVRLLSAALGSEFAMLICICVTFEIALKISFKNLACHSGETIPLQLMRSLTFVKRSRGLTSSSALMV